MIILRTITEGLTLLIGVAGLAWILAETSMRAMDAVCRAFHVHKYFAQFVYERHREYAHKQQAARDNE